MLFTQLCLIGVSAVNTKYNSQDCVLNTGDSLPAFQGKFETYLGDLVCMVRWQNSPWIVNLGGKLCITFCINSNNSYEQYEMTAVNS